MSRISVMHVRDSKGIYGAERVILTLAKNLDHKRFNFSLLCFTSQDGKANELMKRAVDLGVDVIPVNVQGRMDFRAIKRIRNIIKEKKISIVHSHDFKSDFYALLASIQSDIRRVAMAHGSTRDSILKKAYLYLDERITYGFSDRVIAVSDSVRKDLEGKGLKHPRLVLIHNGFDENLMVNDDYHDSPQFPEIKGGGKLFGVVGRLFPDKGHRFFLDAFAAVCKVFPQTRAVIVGDGPARSAIEGQVKSMNLSDAVILCGFQRNMHRIYDRLDFLVIPSLTEGLPYTLLEAMSEKIPVIATTVGDIPSIIQHGKSGYLVPPSDSGSLEKSMLELLYNPEQTQAMAEEAHRTLCEQFTADKMVAQTEQLYLSLVDDEKR